MEPAERVAAATALLDAAAGRRVASAWLSRYGSTLTVEAVFASNLDDELALGRWAPQPSQHNIGGQAVRVVPISLRSMYASQRHASDDDGATHPLWNRLVMDPRRQVEPLVTSPFVEGLPRWIVQHGEQDAAAVPFLLRARAFRVLADVTYNARKVPSAIKRAGAAAWAAEQLEAGREVQLIPSVDPAQAREALGRLLPFDELRQLWSGEVDCFPRYYGLQDKHPPFLMAAPLMVHVHPKAYAAAASAALRQLALDPRWLQGFGAGHAERMGRSMFDWGSGAMAPLRGEAIEPVPAENAETEEFLL